MSNFIIFFVFAVLLLLFVLLGIKRKERYPFRRRKYLMSVPERKFYEHLLSEIDADTYAVFPQVPLSRVIEVSVGGKEFWRYFNRINKKIVDFVVFKKPYYEPVLVIEYDDETHTRKDRKKRDIFLDSALKAANVPVIHVKYGEGFHLKSLKEIMS